ncbi:monocarboxylate transporter 10-like isoform X2 [Eriocheir sinensis]|uniref:monocarboxylate transporter 10-like isoform X2 n=1 Tax=Eriocheir sinensis TaxID=95602 RepID=UPI0021C8DB0A|nr:monocarboxylate transporter 10-like isoform X2 [Eriocheir sinensis]
MEVAVAPAAPAAQLPRSKSFPGENSREWEAGEEVDSGVSRSQGSGGARDSGVVVVASDQHSFASDARSSLLGELPSGVAISELPSECGGEKQANADDPNKKETIGRHYYPEGGWGWVVLLMALLVHVASHGLHQAAGVLLIHTLKAFPESSLIGASWLGGLSTSIALLISPVTIGVCRRNSTRLTAVLGGLVTALGCLFTSFASQFHQLFFSYGTVIGIGVGMTRDSSTLMVGQYFKRRREFVEIIVVSGSGLGISVMSLFIRGAIGSIGWRLGLQAVTGVVFLTFLMGTFYRSASLYHPQRRAILHLKNQKRKIKEKNRQEDKPPFFDVTTLKSKTVQILLLSIGLSSFGITSPIIYLAHQAEEQGLGDSSVLLLQTYLGLGWVIGVCAFGFVVLQKSTECRVGRQYLCQASMFLCGVCTLAFTAVEGYHGYVLFAWLYGIFCGGFHYSLKMYTYEKVRARNFARTWGFVQCSQAIPTAIGVPITGYINIGYGDKAGYYFSSTFVIFGSMTIFLIDIHRRNAAKHKHTHKSGENHTCAKETCPESRRRDSLAQLTQQQAARTHGPNLAFLHQRSYNFEVPEQRNKPELTCISEEGIADMDLPDHLLEDLDYLGDCITSCDKVENYLMMSEYENNLGKTAELPYLAERKGRKRLLSFHRQPSSLMGLKDSPKKDKPPDKTTKPPDKPGGAVLGVSVHEGANGQGAVGRGGAGAGGAAGVGSGVKPSNPRSITVIEEASV